MLFPRLQKRGPIEAQRSTRHHLKHDVRFHAYKSVAPLKHELASARSRENLPCFHAYKSVAPLKRTMTPKSLHRAPCFHAYKSVAPLKLVLLVATSGANLFPRLQKRGPIEANSYSTRCRSARMFPRLQKRGPIEASESSRCSGPKLCVSTLTKAWPH